MITKTQLQSLIDKIDTTGNEGTTGQELKDIFEALKDVVPNYKKLVATVSQSGSNAPTMTILENTFGIEPTWEYIGTGQYDLVFPNNTFTEEAKIVTNEKARGASGNLWFVSTGFGINSGSTIKYFVFLNESNADGWLYNAPIEIRVYE